MILVIILFTLIYSIRKKKYNISILLLCMLSIISRCFIKNRFSIWNLLEGFNTDKLRFIPCSNNTNNMHNNYQLDYIDPINKKNDILQRLYSDDIDKMFTFPSCSVDQDYNFNKSYSGYFDRKIYSTDSIQQKINDNHNIVNDSLIYNDPELYRHPKDLETKIISDYDNEFKGDFENYLDENKNVIFSFNRGLKYTTCGDIDNKGTKYNCLYPSIFNNTNIDVLCTTNNDYCNNVCCK